VLPAFTHVLANKDVLRSDVEIVGEMVDSSIFENGSMEASATIYSPTQAYSKQVIQRDILV
jgi:hypothetical protein